MKILLVAGVLCCFAGTAFAQVFFRGECPTVTVQENFDLNRYMGRWYENRRFFAIFEAFSDCVTADYTLLDDGSVKVNNTGTSTFSLFRRDPTTTAIGNARVVGDVPAKLGVRFSDAQPRGDYWVLKTDYDSYTIVWSCSPLSIFGRTFGNYQFAWILTRDRYGVSQTKTDELLEFMKGFGIDTRKFRLTNQANCARYGGS